MEQPTVLPWHLVEAEATWHDLVEPYLNACIELVTSQFVKSTTDAERAICQGQLLALRNVKDAPATYEYIQQRAKKIEDESREKAQEMTVGRRRTRR